MLMRRRSLLLYLAAWIAVAVLTSTHTVLAYSAEGPVSAATIRFVAVNTFSYWMVWAVAGVVAVVAARRVPVVEREGWWRNLLVHVTLALVLAGLVLVPYRALRFLGGYPPRLDFAGNYLLRLSTGIPTYAIIVGLVSALEFRRRARRAEEEAVELSGHLTRARLDALQARIRPHFLYNTINGIQSLVTEDPRKAEDMLGELGTLLRWTTDAPDAVEVPLAREMQVIESYLRIQGGRFEDRLKVRIDVEPDAASALLPPLILQPLIENAVEHGVARRRKGGRIDVLARKEGDLLTIRVRDDGPGLDEGASDPRGGVGLATTRSRLEAQYGAEASIRVEDRPEGGVEATLTLPFRPAPTELA